MLEKILGVIDVAVTKSAALTRSIYSLFFTTERIIVAKDIGSGELSMKMSLGGFFGGGIGAYAASKNLAKEAEEKAEKLKDLSSEDILRDNKDNFSILYSTISKIEMEQPTFWHVPQIKIFTNDKTYEYHFVRKDNLSMYIHKETFDEYLQVVKSAVPDKLVVK